MSLGEVKPRSAVVRRGDLHRIERNDVGARGAAVDGAPHVRA